MELDFFSSGPLTLASGPAVTNQRAGDHFTKGDQHGRSMGEAKIKQCNQKVKEILEAKELAMPIGMAPKALNTVATLAKDYVSYYKAIFARSLFGTHAVVAVWRTTVLMGVQYWALWALDELVWSACVEYIVTRCGSTYGRGVAMVM
ncbi:hypothetical protein RRG08_004199 [Elysia crispata]|uniref:Uncharacterized protein n=1 Tax=Elysia crispata TaxID=231223 RepID=A0AAE1E2K8_9GAST|nr:hypothetical protein RRG08_004199 [Elysia crispata]